MTTGRPSPRPGSSISHRRRRLTRRQWLPLLTAGVIVVVIVLVTVIVSPQHAWSPGAAQAPRLGSKAIPSATGPTTLVKPGQVAAAKYVCPRYSGIDNANPLPRLYQDTFEWSQHPPYQVGNGKGDIDWRANPYSQPSWYMWFHSLRWLGRGIDAAKAGDKQAMARVTTILQDWIKDNPYDWKVNAGAHESTMHRTNVLICARQAIIAGLKVKTLPASYAWIDRSLLDHAKFLEINFSGEGNHGTDESIAMFGIGCTLQREPLKQLAQRRLTTAIVQAIDEQGSTNEQSTAYAQFNWYLWGRAVKAMKECGVDPGPTITERRRLLTNWLALATNSLGRLHQLGDSEDVQAVPIPGTPLEFAGSLGRKGVRPTQRVGIFDAGYIFGRTGWGEKRRFVDESTYSIRYGRSRTLHGHDDHLSITYTSHGRPILVDGGHAGYKNDKWRDWVKSEYAHNVLASPAMTEHKTESKLVRSRLEPTSEFYDLADVPAPGMTRKRSLLVLKDPDVVVAFDRATSENDQAFQTLWHLPAGQQVAVSSPSTVVAQKPGDTVKTVLLQIPYSEQLAADSVTVDQGKEDPIQGWQFPKITQRLPAPVVSFHRNGRSASILSVIVPAGSATAVSFKTRRSGPTFLIDLTVGTTVTTIEVEPDGTLTRLK
ncbi:heparinase II/III family protein [Kribbella sp. NPDC023855]|uniref:heparinase II/III domain-containing protein n=1 Tax=Kribbella sp. NPDC023855 TaxID=3154698 RepID=UPI0033E5E27F